MVNGTIATSLAAVNALGSHLGTVQRSLPGDPRRPPSHRRRDRRSSAPGRVPGGRGMVHQPDRRQTLPGAVTGKQLAVALDAERLGQTHQRQVAGQTALVAAEPVDQHHAHRPLPQPRLAADAELRALGGIAGQRLQAQPPRGTGQHHRPLRRQAGPLEQRRVRRRERLSGGCQHEAPAGAAEPADDPPLDRERVGGTDQLPAHGPDQSVHGGGEHQGPQPTQAGCHRSQQRVVGRHAQERRRVQADAEQPVQAVVCEARIRAVDTGPQAAVVPLPDVRGGIVLTGRVRQLQHAPPEAAGQGGRADRPCQQIRRGRGEGDIEHRAHPRERIYGGGGAASVAESRTGIRTSPLTWTMTATSTTRPPTSVAVSGVSEKAIHTHSGPNTRSWRVMVLGAANGAATQTTITWDRQTAGIMDTSRRWRVITIATANANDISSETPSPITSASPGVPNMMATPETAITIAAHVRPVTGSRSTTQPSNAASTGEIAWVNSTCATVVWLRATMKLPEAIAVEAATPTPAMPIERNAPTTLPRSVNHTRPSSATSANPARPASCVAVLTPSSRWNRPAVDQAMAARATASWPRLREERRRGFTSEEHRCATRARPRPSSTPRGG